jgi:hypothetical protein
MKYMQLMDFHRTRRSAREQALWWVMFTSDRFASLCLATEYAIPNSHCNIEIDPNGESIEFWHKNTAQIFAMKLAVLIGDLLDFLEGRSTSTSYDSALLLDQQLDKLAAEMPASFWVINKVSSTKVEDMVGLLSKSWGHSIFYIMKVMLHMPYMFKAIKNPGYGYSRDKCFEAARGAIRILHIIRGSPCTQTQCGFDFLGFIGCIVLLLGLQGYGSEDAKQSNLEDWERIESTTELFKGRADKPFDQIASQSYRALLQLTRFRRQPETAKDGVVQVNVPIFGMITVRRGPLEQVPTMHTTYTGLSADKDIGQVPARSGAISRTVGLHEEVDTSYAGSNMRMRVNATTTTPDLGQPSSYMQQFGLQLNFESEASRVGMEQVSV